MLLLSGRMKQKMNEHLSDVSLSCTITAPSLHHHCSCFENEEFEMPDGSVVQVGSEIIGCPELLFNPMLNGKEMTNLDEA